MALEKEASTSTKPLVKSGVDGVDPVVVVTTLSRLWEKKQSMKIWGLGFSSATPLVMAGVDGCGSRWRDLRQWHSGVVWWHGGVATAEERETEINPLGWVWADSQTHLYVAHPHS